MSARISPEGAARTQSLFREVNDRVQRPNKRSNGDTPLAEYVCECASADCVERITLTFGEYQTIRRTPTYFAVVPNYLHVVPEVERIVGKTDRYWIVEKTGVAAEIAVAESTTGGFADPDAA